MSELRPERLLPPNPSLEQHKKQARELLRAVQSQEPVALQRAEARLSNGSAANGANAAFSLSNAQFVIAREHGYPSWPQFRLAVTERSKAFRAAADKLLETGVPGALTSHNSGTVDAAEAVVQSEPALALADIYTAALLGDNQAVRDHLKSDPALANRPGGPNNWPPLLYVCFSRFLLKHGDKCGKFVATARVLLDAGTDPLAYFDANGERGTALYGAAGVSRSPELTRLLLEAGADPNDDEVIYHASEVRDLSCLKELVSHGHDLNRTGTALLRRLDSEDLEGVTWILEAGANPNAGLASWGKTALHQAVMRNRSVAFFPPLLAYGADPSLKSRAEGKTAYEMAMRLGREDVAQILRAAGNPPELSAVDQLLAACASADEAKVKELLAGQPARIPSVTESDQRMIVETAAAGKTESVRLMLDVGFPIDGHGSSPATPLHQAAWYGHLDTVELLLARGADPLKTDRTHGGTALHWALHASSESHDTVKPYADIVDRLISAGSPVPEQAAGSDEVQAVLRNHGAS